MVIAAATLALALAAPQDHRVEYKFKGNLARFRNVYWKHVVGAEPSTLLVADSPKGLATGTWIYFDMPNNKIIIGSNQSADTPKNLVDYIEQFDVAPRSVRMTIKFEQPDKGFELKSTIETLNNQPCILGSPEMDGLVTLGPRINDDGTLNVRVSVKFDHLEFAQNLRIKNMGSAYFDRGSLRLDDQKDAVQIGSDVEVWKNDRFEIKAQIVE